MVRTFKARAAVVAVIQGESGVMIGLERINHDWQTTTVPITTITDQERTLPTAYWATVTMTLTPRFTPMPAP